MGANRPPSEGVECRLGSSIIKLLPQKKELDKALNNVKLTKDMSIEHFRVLYQNALDDYNTCPSIQKWVDTQEGDDEQIEFLLHLLGEGKVVGTSKYVNSHDY